MQIQGKPERRPLTFMGHQVGAGSVARGPMGQCALPGTLIMVSNIVKGSFQWPHPVESWPKIAGTWDSYRCLGPITPTK